MAYFNGQEILFSPHVHIKEYFQTLDARLFDFVINAGMSSQSIVCNIRRPIVLSAVSHDPVFSSPSWRVKVVYEDGAVDYVGDEGYINDEIVKQFPYTFNATEENPIVTLMYSGGLLNSGSYDVQVSYETATDANAFVDGTITEIWAPNATTACDYALYKKPNIETIYMPNLTTAGNYSFGYMDALKDFKAPKLATVSGNGIFYGCAAMEYYDLPLLTSIPAYGWANNTALKSISLPSAIGEVKTYAFSGCTALERAEFPKITEISSSSFYRCLALKTLILGTANSTSIVTLANTNAFTATPIAGGTGYIYVADSLVNSYKAATNWATYANQIRGLSELGTVYLGTSFTVTEELAGKNIYIMINRFDQDGYYNENGSYPSIAVSWNDGTDAGSFGDWGGSNKVTEKILLNTAYSAYLSAGTTLTLQQYADFGELYFAYYED